LYLFPLAMYLSVSFVPVFLFGLCKSICLARCMRVKWPFCSQVRAGGVLSMSTGAEEGKRRGDRVLCLEYPFQTQCGMLLSLLVLQEQWYYLIASCAETKV
jgi:hypothetical protein